MLYNRERRKAPVFKEQLAAICWMTACASAFADIPDFFAVVKDTDQETGFLSAGEVYREDGQSEAKKTGVVYLCDATETRTAFAEAG